MRTHTYVLNKGYTDEYKGRKVSWEVPTTVAEAIERGFFDSEDTIVREAVNQLNIKRGHAIQKATIEQLKDAEGKPNGTLANPSMTVASMEQLAVSVVAKKSDRTRGVGGAAKDRAKRFDTTATKAKEIAATASPEKLATLLELGLISQEEHDTRLAAIPTKRNR